MIVIDAGVTRGYTLHELRATCYTGYVLFITRATRYTGYALCITRATRYALHGLHWVTRFITFYELIGPIAVCVPRDYYSGSWSTSWRLFFGNGVL